MAWRNLSTKPDHGIKLAKEYTMINWKHYPLLDPSRKNSRIIAITKSAKRNNTPQEETVIKITELVESTLSTEPRMIRAIEQSKLPSIEYGDPMQKYVAKLIRNYAQSLTIETAEPMSRVSQILALRDKSQLQIEKEEAVRQFPFEENYSEEEQAELLALVATHRLKDVDFVAVFSALMPRATIKTESWRNIMTSITSAVWRGVGANKAPAMALEVAYRLRDVGILKKNVGDLYIINLKSVEASPAWNGLLPPMKEKPLPLDDNGVGGYILGKRGIKNGRKQPRHILDFLEMRNNIPMEVSKDIAWERVAQFYQDRAIKSLDEESTKDDQVKVNNEAKQNILRTQAYCRAYENMEFYVFNETDFRSRTYTSADKLNMQGDGVSKAITVPAQGFELPELGTEEAKVAEHYIIMDIMNEAGFDKLCETEKLSKWYEMIDVNKGGSYEQFINNSELPVMTHRQIATYFRWLSGEKNVNVAVPMDASNQVLQISMVAFDDDASGRVCNASAPEIVDGLTIRADAYIMLADSFNKALKANNIVN